MSSWICCGALGWLDRSAITSRKKCPLSCRNVDRSAFSFRVSSSWLGLNVPRGPCSSTSPCGCISPARPSVQANSGSSPVFWSAKMVSSTLAVWFCSPKGPKLSQLFWPRVSVVIAATALPVNKRACACQAFSSPWARKPAPSMPWPKASCTARNRSLASTGLSSPSIPPTGHCRPVSANRGLFSGLNSALVPKPSVVGNTPICWFARMSRMAFQGDDA